MKKRKGLKVMVHSILALVMLTVMMFVHQPTDVSAADHEVSLERIYSSDRYTTSVEISSEAWENSDTVLIASGDIFTDTLAGVPLAKIHDAPILLVRKNSMEEEVKNEIKRLGATNAIILGGPASISNAIESELQKFVSTRRIADTTRYNTSVKIAEEVIQSTNSDTGVLVSGDKFADAISIAPFAAHYGMPIYLTRQSSLPEEMGDITNNHSNWYAIGGPHTISQNVLNNFEDKSLTHLYDSNRYNTNLKIIEHFNFDSGTVYIASGEIFTDALVGSALAAKTSSPIILVNDESEVDVTNVINYLEENPHKNIKLLGGPASISQEFSDRIFNRVIPRRYVSRIYNEIPYEENRIEDPSKDRNYKEVVQEGQVGELETISTSYYLRDELIHEEQSEEVLKEPVEKITVFGTKGLSNTGPTQGYIVDDLIDNEGHRHHGSEILNFDINAEVDMKDLVEMKKENQDIIDKRANDDSLMNTYTLFKDHFGFGEETHPIKLSQETINLVHDELIDVGKVNEIYLDLLNKEREKRGQAPTRISYKLAEGAEKRTLRYEPHKGILNKPSLEGNSDWYDDFDYLNNQNHENHYAQRLNEYVISISFEGNPYTLASERWLAEKLYDARLEYYYTTDIMNNPVPFYIDYQLFDYNRSSIWDLTDDFTITYIYDFNRE